MGREHHPLECGLVVELQVEVVEQRAEEGRGGQVYLIGRLLELHLHRKRVDVAHVPEELVGFVPGEVGGLFL